MLSAGRRAPAGRRLLITPTFAYYKRGNARWALQPRRRAGRGSRDGRVDRAARRRPPRPSCRPPGRPPAGSRWACRLANLLAVVLPLLGLAAAGVFLWGRGFSWVELGLLLGMYVLTALGITVGFHRLFTHRSFETYPAVQFILGVARLDGRPGAAAQVGGLPSPAPPAQRQGRRPALAPPPRGRRPRAAARPAGTRTSAGSSSPTRRTSTATSKTLRKSGLLRTVKMLFPLWVALGLVIPAVVGGAADVELDGRWYGLAVGRAGAGVPGPPRDLERQLGLPPVGHAAVPQRRPEPQQLPVRRPGMGEGWHNTTTPSRLRPATACAVAARHELLGHPGLCWPRLEAETAGEAVQRRERRSGGGGPGASWARIALSRACRALVRRGSPSSRPGRGQHP